MVPSPFAGLGDRDDALGRVVRRMEERRWFAARQQAFRASGRAFAVSAGMPAPQGPHLLVVPHEGEGSGTWRPASGNPYFEAAQTAREQLESTRVSVVSVAPNEPARAWHERVISFVRDEGVTHVLAHTEGDPSGLGQWSWDELWWQLSGTEVVLLGMVFDSAFRWVNAGSRLLARISPRFLNVDICMPMDNRLVRGRPEVGPVNWPLSNLAFDEIDRRISDVGKEFDLSFIGALYPYRVELIERLRAMGVRVAVNPHRLDETYDFASSRRDQPTYLDYMAGLAASEMTVNFSRSSAGPYEQLKTRVVEASSVGCLVLTDDRDRTGRFWIEEREFGRFEDLADIPALVERWLSDPAALRAAQSAARVRARELAGAGFWQAVNAGLAARRLPALP